MQTVESTNCSSNYIFGLSFIYFRGFTILVEYLIYKSIVLNYNLYMKNEIEMEMEMKMKKMESTEFEFGGVIGNEDGVAGDSPYGGFGIFRWERSCTDGDVNSLHGERMKKEKEMVTVCLGFWFCSNLFFPAMCDEFGLEVSTQDLFVPPLVCLITHFVFMGSPFYLIVVTNWFFIFYYQNYTENLFILFLLSIFLIFSTKIISSSFI